MRVILPSLVLVAQTHHLSLVMRKIPTEGHVKYYLSCILQTVKVIQNMV